MFGRVLHRRAIFSARANKALGRFMSTESFNDFIGASLSKSEMIGGAAGGIVLGSLAAYECRHNTDVYFGR